MPTRLTIASVLLLTSLAGCQTIPDETQNPVLLDAEAYDRVFEASVQVLRDYRFEVDRQDHRFGRVTTLPKDSPTVFEPWHPDNSTLGQALESTLDHQRRTVSLFFDPTEAGEEEYALRAEVLLERRVQPARRLVDRTSGNVFNEFDAVPAEWRRRGIERRYWEPVGGDARLEQRLLREIVERVRSGYGED